MAGQFVEANPASGGADFSTFENVGDSANTPLTLNCHPELKTARTNINSANTNVALVSPAAGNALGILGVTVAIDNNVAASPSILIGLAAAVTPTTLGVVYSHPGIPSGFVDPRGNNGGVIGLGAADEKLLITNAAPTAGSFDVVVTYFEFVP